MKYGLDVLLLYLDNNLPDIQQAEEISKYLKNNPRDLIYAMELARIKSWDESQVNKISFNITKSGLEMLHSGLVNLLQSKKLAFRGEVQGCEYEFLGISLKFVYLQADVYQLQLKSQRALYCEIIKDNSIFIFQDEVVESDLLSLDVGSLYHLIVHIDNELKILEIKL